MKDLPFAKPKRNKTSKRPATVAEKKWMARVSQLGCIVPDCNANWITVHHWRPDGVTDNYKAIPLCREHHQGDFTITIGHDLSIHGAQKSFETKYGTQASLLCKTYELLLNDGGLPEPAMKIYKGLKEAQG